MTGAPGPGLRTMSGALHHFGPAAVVQILSAVVAARQPLCVVDVAASPAVRRLPWPVALPAVAINAAMLVVVALAVTPFVRPVRASPLVLTYLLPLIPLVFAWDGTVSALRAYSPDELLTLAARVPGSAGYTWDAGRRGPLLYLTGLPR